jgi:aldehyde dehydrogenase (NAD+)
MPSLFGNYVGGQWVECKSKQTFPNINPADIDEVVGLFQRSAAEDMVEACDAAAKAQPSWAASPAPRRGEFLFKAAEILESRLPQLGEDMTREEGKTLPEAKAEVKRAINIFRYFGGEGARQFS